MTGKAVALIVVLGAVLAVSTAALFGIPAADLFSLVGLTVIASMITGLAGGGALYRLRHRSLAVQTICVAITTVATVAVGASAAAGQMFISSHDLAALWVILVAAGTIGMIVALILGRRATSAIGSLRRAAQTVGRGEPLRDIDPSLTGEFAHLGAALKDMSAKLHESLERERALDSSRRELVAWVSHDLRTPLAGIRAMTEALEDKVVVDPVTTEKYYRDLRKEAERLSDLVDDLFELSRINAGALRLQIEKASLEDLVSDALAASAGVAKAKGVKLTGRLTGDVHEIDLSTPEMARALRNLMENAIRHTPSDGSVQVEAGIEEGHAYLAVVDGCGGIPANDIERVFDVAYRGASARSPDGDSGAGLGLAIARGIVEAHRGEIAVHNVDQGCRFVVRLPVSQPAE